MSSRINPNSSIRSGYVFEDLYVLKLCVNWLRQPDLYTALRIQYVPDVIQDARFSIDDIVATDADGRYEFYQLKHLQNPDTDFWDFEKLLEKGLKKWISSYSAIQKGQLDGIGALITNGFAAPEVSACLLGNKLRYDALTVQQPALLQGLQSGQGIDAVKLFLQGFAFEFGKPGKQELERQLRDQLNYELKVTEEGVNRLLLYIANQGSEKHPITFQLSDIRAQLSWDDPRPLNQEFHIPVDFEFFNKEEHARTIRDLRDLRGGIKVFTGKPGSGKSTYLSKLYQILGNKLGLPVIRHHYHLSTRDSSFRDRLNADRVKEALKAEFKKQKEEVLDQLAISNTSHVPLREFISKVSTFYAQKGQTFILIIDGLDHVIRESRDARELSEFIDQVLYPQEGFWLVLGTQEVTIPYLPNVISRYASVEEWVEIKGLHQRAVEKIFRKDPVFKQLLPHEQIRGKIVPLLFRKTQGNPLHLRYVLGQVALTGKRISYEKIEEVLPYQDEISSYYRELWQALSPLSKTFALAVTALDFRLQEEQLFDLAAHLTAKPHEITEAYQAVKHLFRLELSGITIYHNSFGVFVTSQAEFAQQKKSLYRQLKNWLKKPSQKDLAWAELLKIEYELGNDRPLLQVDKKWVIDSYLQGRDEETINKILLLAAEAAFKKKRFGLVADFKHLQVYFSNKHYSLHRELPVISAFAIQTRQPRIARFIDFDQLEHYQIKNNLIDQYDLGKIQRIPEPAIQRFNELLSTQGVEKTEVVNDLLEVLAHIEPEPFRRIYKFITYYRAVDQSADFFDHYLQQLLIRKRIVKTKELLGAQLTAPEKGALALRLIEYQLISGDEQWSGYIVKFSKTIKNHWRFQLYHLLSEGKLLVKPSLSASAVFPEKLDYHGTRDSKAEKLYTDNFYARLLLVLAGQSIVGQDWLDQAGKSWQMQLMTTVHELSNYLNDCYQTKSPVSVAALFDGFNDLPDLDFYANHEKLEIKRTIIPVIIKEMLFAAAALNKKRELLNEFTADDVNAIFDSKWLNPDTKNEIFASTYFTFSDKGYQTYQTLVTDYLSQSLIPFHERAGQFMQLALRAAGLGHQADARKYLQEAAEQVISYGHHKDMTLDGILESIRACGAAGSKKTVGFLREIATYVYYLEDLTDGDETGSFIYEWAGLLSTYDPELHRNLYLEKIEKREYQLSESIFATLLEQLDWQNPIDLAVAETAISRQTFFGLTSLQKENPAVDTVIDRIHEQFGPVDYNEAIEREDYGSHPRELPERSALLSIKPADLKNHYLNLPLDGYAERKYAQINYLRDWCSIWLAVSSTEIPGVVSALKTVICENFEDIDHETLDQIYPYALIHDPSFAFDCLCRSYANNRDWGPTYVRGIESAEQKWHCLRRDFPGREDEFFERTIFYTGKSYGRGESYYMPVPKVIQYFIYMGALGKAEALVRSHIDFLPTLFPGVTLPVPAFISHERKVTSLELLLTRVAWMSPFVRERAAYRLADLLAADTSGEIHGTFLDWLGEQELETYACYGLLILLRSLHIPESASNRHLNFNTVYPLTLRCMATDLLLMAIAKKTGKKFFCDFPMISEVELRRDEMTEAKFRDNVQTYLPAIYFEMLRQMQQKTHREIWRIWYNLFIQRTTELDLRETYDDRNYHNREHEQMTGRSPLIAELYKSTYFNLIDYLYHTGVIDAGDLDIFTKKNLPVDLSLWAINLSPLTEWWPSFNPKTSDLALAVKKLLISNDQHRVLHLHGAVRNGESYYQSTQQGEIHVLPFAYKFTGGDQPPAKAIYEALVKNQGQWYSATKNFDDFGFFDHPITFHRAKPENVFSIQGLQLVNLVAPISLDTIHFWQYYRVAYSPVLPDPVLSGNLEPETDNGKLVYREAGQVKLTVHDIALGVRDEMHTGDIIPSGNYVLINQAYLDEKLKKTGMRLGYVYKLQINQKSSTHSRERQKSTYYETIDLS